MTTNLEKLLARIEELHQQTTFGPWQHEAHPNGGRTVYALESDGEKYEVARVYDDEESDAELVALSRTALPALAKALRRAHTSLEQVEMISGKYADAHDAANVAMFEASRAITEIESILAEALK